MPCLVDKCSICADTDYLCIKAFYLFVADSHEKIKSLNAEIISVSTDTAFVHKAWHDKSETIKKIKFPMLADHARRVCKAYWTLIEDEGLSLRATYLINPEGIIKALEFHDNKIGR